MKTETGKIIHIPESTHWYDEKGNPVLEITGANGKLRPPTLRDAKKVGYFPSVTSINDIIAKPAIKNWLIQTTLEMAVITPRIKGEEDNDYIERISMLAEAERAKPREYGSRLHAAIESSINEEPCKTDKIGERAIAEVKAWLGSVGAYRARAEVPFCNVQFGFGGKTDMIVECMDESTILPDIKTTKRPPKKAYPEWGYQLAGYKLGLELDDSVECVNLVIDQRTGRLWPYPWKKEDIRKATEVFKLLLSVWFKIKKFDPRLKNANVT